MWFFLFSLLSLSFFLSGSFYLIQAGLKLVILGLSLPNAESTGMHPVPGSASFDISYLLAMPIDTITGMSLDLARQAFGIGLDHICLVYHEQDIFPL